MRKLLYTAMRENRARRLGRHIVSCIQGCASLLDYGAGNMVLARYLQSAETVAVTGRDVVDNNLTD